MSRRTVLISGAGIAGPALAYWLNRYGFEVTVVEVADGIRPGGQTVDLRGAGREVIERMGLMPRARELAMVQRGIADVAADGRHLSEMTVEVFGGEGIISEIELLRGELAELIYDAARHDVEYLFGTRITSLEERADDVRVILSDGSSRHVDLVVGADGPHSATRRLAFGPAEQFVHPVGGYTAWFTAADSVGLDGWYEMHNEAGGLVASMRPDRTPGMAKAGLAFASGPLDYDRRDVDAQRRILADRFCGMGWQAQHLIAAASVADDFYFDALVQVKMDRWTTGRIALVGDAGYCPCPLSGLGTSVGLVGAYLLAGEIATTPDHAAAFSRYEELLRPYVTEAQRLPPGGIKGYAPMAAWRIRARIVSTRMMVSRPLRGLARRLFFSKAEAIELPSYRG